MPITFTELKGIPLVYPGDSISQLILQALDNSQIDIQDNDILVIAQKIVSKSENRLVNITEVNPSPTAKEIAQRTQKDARFVELVLQESDHVIRTGINTLIVQHRLGFICANAGIDHSNVKGSWGNADDWVLLLPKDPDASASQIRSDIEQTAKKKIGVMIIDSHGRAWRNGTVGISIGFSGIPGVVDLRGKPDLFGFQLRITQVGAADELAAGASLLMGQADEMTPVIHVRGFPYPLREGRLPEMIRSAENDLFR